MSRSGPSNDLVWSEYALALVARARAECDRVVATLFVNPKQFNDPDDLDSYPADEPDDAARFAGAGVDLLFAPTVPEM